MVMLAKDTPSPLLPTDDVVAVADENEETGSDSDDDGEKEDNLVLLMWKSRR